MKELKAFLTGGGRHLCRVLMKAWQQAEASGGHVWESATEVSDLVQGGASATAVEYLLSAGYAEARTETTKSGAALRSFVEGGRRAFAPGSCMVLTPAGADFATGLLAARFKKKKRRADGAEPGDGDRRRGSERPKRDHPRAKESRRPPAATEPATSAGSAPSEKPSGGEAAAMPVWNEATGDLYWCGQFVLHLAAQAKAERPIVRGLAALGLPATIANPLSGPGAGHARRNAVRELKKRQHPLRIEFQSLSRGRIGWFEVE